MSTLSEVKIGPWERRHLTGHHDEYTDGTPKRFPGQCSLCVEQKSFFSVILWPDTGTGAFKACSSLEEATEHYKSKKQDLRRTFGNDFAQVVIEMNDDPSHEEVISFAFDKFYEALSPKF